MADWAEIERLCRTSDETFGQIAKRFGVTRNAIIGRSHRKGWRPTLTIEQAKEAQRIVARANRPAARSRAFAGKGGKPKPPKMEPIANVEKAASADPRMIPLAELTLNTCRWPIGPVRGAAQVFCGRWCDEKDPYCPTCIRKHRPFKPPEKNSSANELIRSLRRYA